MAATAALGLTVTTVTALPAAAAPDGLAVSLRPSSMELSVGGGSENLTVTVKNNSRRAAGGELELHVPLGDLGVRLSGAPNGCEANEDAMRCGVPRLEPGRSVSVRVKIAPPRQSDLAPGDKREGVGRAVVRGDGILDGEAEAPLRVRLSATAIVPEVSGKVVTGDDKPVPDTLIKIKDSAGHEHSTSTGRTGTFRFRASAEKPLVPGVLQVMATKPGFREQTKRVTGRGGQAVRDVKLSLLSASATASVTPTEEGPADTAAPDTPGATPAPAGNATGLGLLGWLAIILGILFLGGGTVVIVLLMRRRDGDEDGDDPDDPYQHTGPLPAAGGAPGVYRSGGSDTAHPTTAMASPSGGIDAPTMLHDRPFVDHVAGASAASQAARSRGYDDAGQQTQLNSLVSDDRDDPTQLHPGAGRHSASPDDGYDAAGRHSRDGHAGGYGGDGYGRGDGYGGAAGGGRHGGDHAGYPDQGYGRQDPDDRDGYGGRRRSVSWGD